MYGALAASKWEMESAVETSIEHKPTCPVGKLYSLIICAYQYKGIEEAKHARTETEKLCMDTLG